jgi:hypothetical protein
VCSCFSLEILTDSQQVCKSAKGTKGFGFVQSHKLRNKNQRTSNVAEICWLAAVVVCFCIDKDFSIILGEVLALDYLPIVEECRIGLKRYLFERNRN